VSLRRLLPASLLLVFAVQAAAQPASPLPTPPEIRAAFRRGDYDGALALAERLASGCPESSEAHLWLARAYGEKARASGVFSLVKAYALARKAKASWEKAVALDPDNVLARSDLVEYHVRAPAIVGGDAAEARRQADEILRRNPARGHLAWGSIHEAGKEYAKAETEFRCAAETDGADAADRVRGWWRLARVYEKQGKKEDAVAALRCALEVDPGYDRAREDLERLSRR
jgi:tetratricopeptide (TPR) repeat protein